MKLEPLVYTNAVIYLTDYYFLSFGTFLDSIHIQTIHLPSQFSFSYL